MILVNHPHHLPLTMKCLLVIILGIAIYGNPVASHCYTCTSISVDGSSISGSDDCTHANFDPYSDYVQETPCSGQCMISEVIDDESADGSELTFTRGCGDDVCGQQQEILGLTCCDGNLCNGPWNGPIQNCYTCTYSSVDGSSISDYCTDANFDLYSDYVQETPCSGQCMIIEVIEENPYGIVELSFTRGCGEDVCDQQEIIGLICCDGHLCNVPWNGQIGNPVAFQNCYACTYSISFDDCTHANFDPYSDYVQETPCSGQCMIIEVIDENPYGSGGELSFTRGCGEGVCGQQDIRGLTCCDGHLCNGPWNGPSIFDPLHEDGNQCYFCSDYGYGCDDDNFDQAYAPIVTCAGSCTKEWGRAQGIAYSSRGCATNDQGLETVCSENSCDFAESAYGSAEACRFCCDGQLCNGAGSVVISTAVIFSATAVSALLVMIF